MLWQSILRRKSPALPPKLGRREPQGVTLVQSPEQGQAPRRRLDCKSQDAFALLPSPSNAFLQKTNNFIREDGTIDTNGARASGSGTGTHKLGPKANQGAINAGLRALDRTGKPCRKWERKTFQLKSFTGATWQVPSWRAPPKPKSLTSIPNGDNNKENNDSSALPSEKSHAGENDTPPFPGNTDSSPAPVSASA